MDVIDRKILERLNVDGRITMKNLANELGLSAPAVAERVKRLEQKGIITAYKAIINREKLGQGITVFITIDMPASKYDEFKEFANNTSEISEFYYLTGQYSLIIKAYVTSTTHLAELLEGAQQFGTTETFVVMYAHVKDNIFWYKNEINMKKSRKLFLIFGFFIAI